MDAKQITVQISDNRGGKTHGHVELKAWDQPMRVKRALKALGGCWLAAAISVVVPLWHFVGVPVFFIAGPILAAWIYKQDEVILGGKGTCPKCQVDLKIERGRPAWPLSETCGSCLHQVSVAPTTSSSSS